MQIIGLGLHNTQEWDLANQVPVQSIQHRANDLVGTQHVSPKYTETRDVHTLDLYVPTVPYVQRMRGSTSESTLLYDRGLSGGRCPLRGLWGCLFTGKRGLTKLNATSKRVRVTPY